VTLERILGAFWYKAVTTLLAAAAKNIATSFGGHAGAEAELLFAGAFRGLEGAFAHGLGLVRNLGCCVEYDGAGA